MASTIISVNIDRSETIPLQNPNARSTRLRARASAQSACGEVIRLALSRRSAPPQAPPHDHSAQLRAPGG
jgi:hypothetical protein